MPKKRAPAYTHTKPGYVHPSLQRVEPSTSSAAPQTVNERIRQLRREQAPRVTAQQRDDLTDVVTKRTIPAHLRRILQMPEVDSPRPKPGTRPRGLRAGPRPPPGPAAPSSWLQSRHAPDNIRNLRKFRHGEEHRPQQLSALAKAYYTEYNSLPPTRSLVHQCLRIFATHWEELIEYEQHYVSALPESLKETLLSYLSVYGAPGCLDLHALKILFARDADIADGTGSDGVRFLDLTGLLNLKYRLTDLSKSLNPTRTPGTAGLGALANLSLDNSVRRTRPQAGVAESWEDDEDEASAEETAEAVPSALSIPQFPNLTRLSLAHPGDHASWTDLLLLSKHLKTLTHLSLAHWPIPCTTPNAATASMVSAHTKPVALGGSHFYSELDNDWHEAANILRRLSLNTYCLKWLDLEGCTWLKALTWDYPEENTRPDGTQDPAWVRPTSQAGPDWNDAWRQIEYINLYQGWIPDNMGELISMPASKVTLQLLGWLRQRRDEPEARSKLRKGTAAEVVSWVERERIAENVAADIRSQRRQTSGSKWCQCDHGWETVTTRPKQDPAHT